MNQQRQELCDHLQLLLATDDGASVEQIEQAIATHITTCSRCTAADQALTMLIATYRKVEAPLADDVEQRLLEDVCRAVSGAPAHTATDALAADGSD